MATAAIPRSLVWLLGCVAIPMTGIAASTNVAALLEFGHKLYGSTLYWTLAAAVITYEIVSSVVFFMAPKELPGLRKSAAMGALLGFAATFLLAILWELISDGVLPGGLWLKLVMKPVPSLIAASFIHMFVMVWQAVTAAKDAAEEPAAKPTPAPIVTAPVVLPPVPAGTRVHTPGSNPAPLPPTPTPAAPKAPAPAAATRPRRPRPTAPAAVPAIVQAQLPTAAEEPKPAAEPELPRVAREHVERAFAVLAAFEAGGGDPAELESGQAMKDFHGSSDRTVRAALQVARHELGIPSKTRKQRQFATV